MKGRAKGKAKETTASVAAKEKVEEKVEAWMVSLAVIDELESTSTQWICLVDPIQATMTGLRRWIAFQTYSLLAIAMTVKWKKTYQTTSMT
jgi:hypothetical protein